MRGKTDIIPSGALPYARRTGLTESGSVAGSDGLLTLSRMADPPTILHLADSHIGADLPRRRRGGGRRRGDDLIDSYHAALRRAREFDVGLIIHAGDVFDSPRPGAEALHAAAAPMLEIAASGVPIVIVPGNHERSVLSTLLLFAHRNIHIVTGPTTLVFDVGGVRVAVASFPCIRRGAALAFGGMIEASGWRPNESDVDILAIHQTLESAVCGPGNYRFRSGDDAIGRDAVPREFDYVAAGHIHRHQTLHAKRPGGPPMVYAGSTDRVSFAEKDEPKGCMILTLDGGKVRHRFVEHDVRPMSVVPIDVTGRTKEQVRESITDALDGLPADAVASIRLTGRAAGTALRGLGLAKLCRERRPDALVRVSADAVEFDSPDARVTTDAPGGSAFDVLTAPDVRIVRRSVRRTRLLPTRCGTYALYDCDNRLLYVGKATHARSRIESHLRGPGAARFDGWPSRIDRIEFRPAHSELEALLIEADLVRRLRPPFNQQMRRWSRYCYLCEDPASGGLSVIDDPAPNDDRYGPFGSARSARAVADALLPLFGDDPMDAMREGRRDLLRGVDDGVLSRLAESIGRSSRLDEIDGAAANALGSTFERLKTIRRANDLLGRPIIMPGPAREETWALLSHGSMQIGRVDAGVREIDEQIRKLARATGRGAPCRFDKSMIDAAIIALRRIERRPDHYRVLATGAFPGAGIRGPPADGFERRYEAQSAGEAKPPSDAV